MKLLIVDDQRDVREALAAMIRRSAYSFIETLEARSAEQAAGLLASQKPGLLLLDIVMPGGDGFSILEEVHRSLPDCRVIMMTGYPEMPYTLRALREQVSGFLVKPVTEADLSDCLSRVLDEKHRRHVGNQLRQDALAQLDLYLSRSDVTLDFQRIRRDCGLEEITEAYLACFLVADGGGIGAGTVGHVTDRLYRHGINAIVYAREKTGLVMIVGMEDARGARLDWLLAQHAALFPTAGIGGAVLPRHAGIKSTYLQAEFACECAVRQAIRGRALLYDQIDVADQLLQLYLPEVRQEAGRAELLFREYGRHRVKPADIVRALNNLFDAWGAQRLAAAESADFPAMRGALLDRLAHVRVDDVCASEKVGGMLRFIRAHYAEQITLTDAANAMNMNYTYASALFKRDTGRNFTEYLQEYRLEKAAYLLRSSNRYSYEVAKRVGFQNEKYFFRLFKRHYGMTPYQYREKGGT